jgi:dGTPase
MDWDLLLSSKRFGSASSLPEDKTMARSQFQRDYDRIVFSSPFRRLQNKAQVFSLPGSVFVHNRLTHSLEVASVGRSLGNALAVELEKHDANLFSMLGSIVSAACLAHDLGNPPFGHSGEKAISTYFDTGKGMTLKNLVSAKQWNDLIHFEGNANAFRVLTHQFNGRRQGGFALTYATLSSLIKYPHGSDAADKKYKYGYFDSEREAFAEIAHQQGILQLSENPQVYCRHPLAYLVEAADDITYQVMDIEDAHKLKILSTEETKEILFAFWGNDKSFFDKAKAVFATVTDNNERISFLRAMLINKLVGESIAVFMKQYEKIMAGQKCDALTENLEGASSVAMTNCSNIAINKIYNHASVVEGELAGYKILGTLLDEFIGAVLEPKSHYAKKLLTLFPEQFRTETDASDYTKIQSVLDFVSGMTDLFALDLYRKITG